MGKYKILFISDHGGDIGGGEKSMLILSKGLIDKGYDIYCVLPNKGAFFSALSDIGAKCMVVKMAVIERGYNPFKIICWLLNIIYFAIVVGVWARLRKIDIIHANKTTSLFHALSASMIAWKPVVWHVRSYNRRFGFVGWVLFKLVDEIICISQDIAKPFLKCFKDSDDKINIVFNGVDIAPFPKVSCHTGGLASLMGIPKPHFIAGIIGRITPVKRIESFLEAFRIISKKHKNIYGAVIGDCVTSNPKQMRDDLSYKEWVVQLHKKWNIENNVKFLGYRNDVEAFLKELDVLVFTSVSEPFGRVLIEAMSLGIPVIAVDAGGVPEIVCDGKTGIIVPKNDYNKLADAIIQVSEEPIFKRRLVEEAWVRVKEVFSSGKYIENVENVYKKIMS